MRQTTLPEELLKDTPSALVRLEELSHGRAQPDVYIDKWSKRSRFAFLIFAGIASWSVIIASAMAVIG